MAALDWAVLLAYFAGITALGLYLGKGQRGIESFLMADRSIPWPLVMVTLIGTTTSAISVISLPAQAYRADLTVMQLYIAAPLSALVVCKIFIPVFYRLKFYSAYEYLETRFDLKTRLLASSIFLALRALFLGIVLFAPSIILSEMTGLSPRSAIVIVGVLTTLYTMLGGLRAVIWADLVQVLIMHGGPLLALFAIIYKIRGGISGIAAIAIEHHKLRLFDFSWSLTSEFTFWGGLIGMCFYIVGIYAVDQSQIQKYMTARSVRESARAVWMMPPVLILQPLLFYILGVALFAFYVVHPGVIPPGTDPDRVFPRFILDELPGGLRGVLIAGVFAAAMSAASGTINSLCTVTVADFLWRGRKAPTSPKGVYVSRMVTAIWGMFGIIAALIAPALGTLFIAASKIYSFFLGALLGVFLLGICTRRAAALGAFVGGLCGLFAVAAIAVFTRISWTWYCAIGTIVSFLMGYAISLLMPKRPEVSLTEANALPMR